MRTQLEASRTVAAVPPPLGNNERKGRVGVRDSGRTGPRLHPRTPRTAGGRSRAHSPGPSPQPSSCVTSAVWARPRSSAGPRLPTPPARDAAAPAYRHTGPATPARDHARCPLFARGPKTTVRGQSHGPRPRGSSVPSARDPLAPHVRPAASADGQATVPGALPPLTRRPVGHRAGPPRVEHCRRRGALPLWQWRGAAPVQGNTDRPRR